METVIVSNSQFYSHYPRQIPKGSVNAEQVEIRLDKSWDGLTVFWHWKNLGTGVEKRDLLKDPAAPNDIPWEVLTDLGELRMGLVGMDGDTVIKPTIWLAYGYVSDGVDPEAGSDPQPPTPSWEQQMVGLATQANQAAQAAQKAAEAAAESVASAGPYAEEAKKSAEAAKASQDAAATSAQQANEAARTAQEAAGSIGDAVKRAENAATAAGAAQQAAEAAQGAAAQSAGTAQEAATTASQAAQTAQGAATQAGQYLASVEADAQAAASAATAAGESKEAAQGAAQAAASARDQANTAAITAQGHATAASTAKTAAEQAATTAGNAQAGAAQSAQAAAGSASAAQQAQQAAEAAAAVLPKPTPEDAGKILMVNPEGNRYIFGEAGGDGGGWFRIAEVTITEPVSSIIISTDIDGKPFSVRDIFAYNTKDLVLSEDANGVFQVIIGKASLNMNVSLKSKPGLFVRSLWHGVRFTECGTSGFNAYHSASGPLDRVMAKGDEELIDRFELVLSFSGQFTSGNLILFGRA